MVDVVVEADPGAYENLKRKEKYDSTTLPC